MIAKISRRNLESLRLGGKHKMKKKVIFSLFLFIIITVISCSSNYDIVIKNGTIYDGSDNPPITADIGIKNGQIKTIGKINNSGKITINAENLIVAPGFIDVHTHCDRSILNSDLSNAKNYLTQGVTTVVTGNCGGGTYQVGEFFRKLDSLGIGVNVIHLIGHGTVRQAVMGQEAREPTTEELDQMKQLVSDGMKEGAAGISSGLFYSPGSFAKIYEIIELAKVVKQTDGIYASHVRDESNYNIGVKESIKEALVVGEKTGITVEISHIKALGEPVWGKASEICEVIENAQRRGVSVYADQYPYTASSTGLSAAVISRWVQADGEMRERLADSKLLSQIKKEIEANITRRGGPESIVLVSYSANEKFAGKNLLEISRILNKPIEETAIQLVLNGSPSIISYNMTDEDVESFMKKSYIMTGSDGSVKIPNERFSHPRSYGTFPRKIRKYVLEKKVISMGQAIRAATSLPAEMLGLKNRGKLKKGFIADIVIFNPEKIEDKATFANPHQYSEGIQYLIINGEIVIEDGKYNGKLAGKTLRMNEK
jgi:N-acyl-D-amino-acid deacylase